MGNNLNSWSSIQLTVGVANYLKSFPPKAVVAIELKALKKTNFYLKPPYIPFAFDADKKIMPRIHNLRKGSHVFLQLDSENKIAYA